MVVFIENLDASAGGDILYVSPPNDIRILFACSLCFAFCRLHCYLDAMKTARREGERGRPRREGERGNSLLSGWAISYHGIRSRGKVQTSLEIFEVRLELCAPRISIYCLPVPARLRILLFVRVEIEVRVFRPGRPFFASCPFMMSFGYTSYLGKPTAVGGAVGLFVFRIL